MAKIVSSDLAPSEQVRYSLGNASFKLGAADSSSYVTDDPVVLASARNHPWLEVVTPKAKVKAPVFNDTGVKAEDDVLSAVGPSAKLVAETPDVPEDITPLAVEAGLDQDKKVVEGKVALTLAADDAPAPKKAAKNTTEAKN